MRGCAFVTVGVTAPGVALGGVASSGPVGGAGGEALSVADDVAGSYEKAETGK
jgi:hypothetical protein